jgi:hypothetical protein
VLTADFLQAIMNKAMNEGQITRPNPCQACRDFPVIKYADDTLEVMKADAN